MNFNIFPSLCFATTDDSQYKVLREALANMVMHADHYSKLRNPTIARLFRFVGIAENAGYGMNKLIGWESLTGAKPTIESNRTIATVSFPLKSALKQSDAKDVPVDVPVNVPVKLTDTQKNILDLISKNANITHSEIAKFLSITDKTAKRTTKALRELGLLKREGSDKTGFWIIL